MIDKAQQSVIDHYNESLNYFNSNNIVSCVLQGSQNYGLDTPSSDVDTKLIIIPTFKDIVMNHKPVSTTHIRANNEHTDFKDIRLYLDDLRKQNINYIETLFTKYYVLNKEYIEQWNRLVLKLAKKLLDLIHIKLFIQLYGVMTSEVKQMEHPTEGRIPVFEKYGYDPKAFSHLYRVYSFMTKYEEGLSYEKCLIPIDVKFALKMKAGEWPAEIAKDQAELLLASAKTILDRACNKYENKENKNTVALLEDVKYEIVKIAMKKELS